MKRTFTTTKATAFLLAAAMGIALTGCTSTATSSENAVYLCTEKAEGDGKITYKYDENGNLLFIKFSDGYYNEYTYDDKNREISKKSINSSGEITDSELTEYAPTAAIKSHMKMRIAVG